MFDVIGSPRQSARRLVERRLFENTILVVIMVNTVTLGLLTSRAALVQLGGVLDVIDQVSLVIFVVELTLRIYAHGWQFFRDPFNVFDFLVVAIALVPAAGPFAILRALRILRLLRLISIVPGMRRVVNGLLEALPGMFSIVGGWALVG